MIEALREQLPIEEFDYNLLMENLKEYKKPRDKVTLLMRDGSIIRVKKGLYTFGPRLQKQPICLKTLANLVYGPSYISKRYALAYYGLINDRMDSVTSMTSERNKQFKTPVGQFSYQHINPQKYPVGVLYLPVDERHFCFIASPEKALADLIVEEKKLSSNQDMIEFLGHGLRIDLQAFNNLDCVRMREIANIYKHPNVTLLTTAMGG